MVKEGLYDREFVTKWTHGFDELNRHVEAYPPEKVAKLTWVKESSIVEAARLIATRKPSAVITFVGLTMGGTPFSADRFPLLSGPSALTGGLTSLEDSKRVLEALLKLDLLVVFELFMTPTAEFADYVLPVTWFLESDAITEYMGLDFIASRTKVLEPAGQAKEEGEVLLQILRSLGMLERLPFGSYRGYLDYRLSPLGMDFGRFVEATYVLNPYGERKYEKGLLRKDGKAGFNTPTGKVELYSTLLKDHGYDPLPVHREPDPGPYTTAELFRDYPFILITGTRSLPFYHGLGLQVEDLRRLHPDPLVEMSPKAASDLRLREGEWVTLEVPGKDERVRRKVHLLPGLDDRMVCAEGHWYLPEEPDQHRRMWETNINVLTSLRDDFDPVIGGSGCRRLLCRVRKA